MRPEPDGLLRLGIFYPTIPFPHFLTPILHEHVPDVLDTAAHRAYLGAAEDLGFDYVFMADTYATYGQRCQELGIASPQFSAASMGTFAAACTSRLGIVTTMQLLYQHPAVIARVGANIDVLSGGRWGMNMVSGSSFAEGLLPEPGRSLTHDERYELAEESMDLIRRLWSGERIDHHGRYFELEGELIPPRPIQEPFPTTVSAGASDAGLALAARYADTLFVPSKIGAAGVAAIRDRLDPALVAAGRAEEDVKLQTNLVVILRDTDEEAQEFTAMLWDDVDLGAAREYVRTITGFSQTYRDLVGEVDRTDDELRTLGVGQGVTQVVGSPATVAETLIALHADQGIRGVAMNFVIWRPSELQRFADGVMPLLEEAGVWASPHRRGWSW